MPEDAELVAFCAPMAHLEKSSSRSNSITGVFFDVCSVKTPLAEALSRMSRTRGSFCPLSSNSGFGKNRAREWPRKTFRELLVAITPLAHTSKDALTTVESLWWRLARNTLRMSADEHDKALAVTSHLPHFLSFAYMLGFDKKLETLTGGGYRDFTRIAAADPELWWGIFQMNREEILRALEKFRLNIDALEDMLVADDHRAGIKALADAVRRKLG